MFNKVGGVQPQQNVSFGTNQSGKVVLFNTVKPDSFESAGNKLSPMGKQVKSLLVKYQGMVKDPTIGNLNPKEFFKGEIDDLIDLKGPKEFYKAFLEVVEKCPGLKPSDLPKREAYTPSIAPHKNYTINPVSRHVEEANKYFTEAIDFVDDHVKKTIPARVRESCIKASNGNIENMAEMLHMKARVLLKLLKK